MQDMSYIPKPSDLEYNVEPGFSCEATYLNLKVFIPDPENRLEPKRVEDIRITYGIDLVSESKSSLYQSMLTSKFGLSQERAKFLASGVDFTKL